MREIRFRAKVTKTFQNSSDEIKKDAWVYGWYYFDSNRNTGIIVTVRHLVMIEIEVDKNTVGQFTGLLGKRHRDIYEGDLLETNLRNPNLPKEKYKVEWSLMNNGWKAFHINEMVEMEAYMFKEAEVVGNIYE